MAAGSITLTLRLNADLKTRLEKLARSTRRTRSFLAAEAIRDYVKLNEWQVEEIEKAIQEAERGEFASDLAVKRAFKKWAGHAR
jgi:predicted transcriptional regulator